MWIRGSQVDGPASELDDFPADEDLTSAVHRQAQRRRTASVLALHNVELARQRAPGREAPAPEVGGRRAGRGILEDRVALGEEEARNQTSTGGREHVGHALALCAHELRQQL